MEIVFRAKLKNVQAKENGRTVQLEPQSNYVAEIADLMLQVGQYVIVTVEPEQGELPIEELDAEYEQPLEGQTEIEVEDEDEDIFSPVVMSLPEPSLPEAEEE